MNEFVLLFRSPGNGVANLSEEEMQVLFKKWQDWLGGIAAQGKLDSPGMRLKPDGKVLKPGGVVTDGPFVEIRERLGGFVVVKAESLDDALTLAHGCPALEMGGSVEVRPFLSYVKPN